MIGEEFKVGDRVKIAETRYTRGEPRKPGTEGKVVKVVAVDDYVPFYEVRVDGHEGTWSYNDYELEKV